MTPPAGDRARPGLRAGAVQRAAGGACTGIDFSPASIACAREHGACTYIQANILQAIDGAVRPLSAGSVLSRLVFVQPLAETLFFRGLAQDNRPFWFVGGIATLL